MSIDAMVISVDEPQLDRCMEAVRRQTVPFSNIIHINGVVPESEAFNRGIKLTTSEWVMHIAGDFILYDNAVELGMNCIIERTGTNICGYFFGLKDSFLDMDIGFGSILRSDVYKSIVCPDKLSDDRKLNYSLRKRGWRLKKRRELIIGTHFDNPDEFQVFRRFYSQTIKYMDGNDAKDRMKELLVKTGNPLYSIGIRTIDFARERKVYPGSKNLTFDRKMYEEFKQAQA